VEYDRKWLKLLAGNGTLEHSSNIGVACEAIESLWRGLAAELGPSGVRVVCLRSAGSPDTPAVQEVFEQHAKAAGVTFDEYSKNAASGTLLHRLPMVAEVANAAGLMASDRASAMTGIFVNVTCGSHVE
jgi:3-oxoacyl-[acyl-carrier protein] reductase